MTRILQISDTHITPDGRIFDPRVDTVAALEATVAGINAQLPAIGPVAMAVVTGDLADTGKPAEYARFLEIMGGLELPWRAIPGNHDDREGMREALRDHAWMPADGPINWRRDLDDLSVIGLDTLVTGAPGGASADDTLNWLEHALSDCAGRPVLIALHHPPVRTGIVAMDRIGLTAPEGLEMVLERHAGPRLLIAGHVHWPITAALGTTPCLIAPGVSHGFAPNLGPDQPHILVPERGGVMLHAWKEGFRSYLLPPSALTAALTVT